jgi:YYY domain-containing protein
LLANYQPSPLVLNLGRADESFTVYDHPKPLVFQKAQQLSAEELRALFEPAMRRTEELRVQRLLKEAADRQEQDGGSDQGKSLLLSEQDRVVQEAGGTFSQMFDPASLANRSPVLVWWLAIELLGLVALPIVFGTFRNLNDRGYFFAKSLGILLLGYLVWLAASVRLLPYTLTSIVLMLGLLAALSWRLFLAQRQAMLDFLQRQRHLILLTEALFLGAYLIFCFIRLQNPDLWQPWLGGEKPMEFAFLNAIIKSTYFPPYDPYFAGGTINYYYYGQYLVATLIKLTGILPSVAFNLAVPTLFALTVLGVFGVAHNLVGGRPDSEEGAGQAMTRNARLGYSLVAALFVAVVGNLNGMVQLVEGFGKNSLTTFRSAIPGLEGAVRLVTGLAAMVTQRLPIPSFDYWRSTRLIPNTINEFPFFSYLFADLHAHMIGIPFTVLVLALALNLARGGRLRDPGKEAAVPAGVGLALLGLFVFSVSLGALAAINSWDVPTYLGILVCALVIREWSVDRRVRPIATLARFVAIAGLGLLLYAPFFQSYRALNVGIGLTTTRTTLADYGQMFGLFLFLLASYLVVEGFGGPEPLARGARLALRRWEELPRVFRLRGALNAATGKAPWSAGIPGGAAGIPTERPLSTPAEGPAPWGLWIAGWVAVVGVVLWLAGLHLFVVLIPLMALTGALALRRGQTPEALFTLLLIFTALLISLGIEVVYLKDFLGGGDYQRMNTVFKFYIQVWVFLGIASAVALARLSGAVIISGRRVLSPAMSPILGAAKAIWWGALAVLLVSVAVYPVVGTVARVIDRFPGARPEVGTLDGMAFMSVGTYTWDNKTIELKYDYEAIQWLLWNVKGSPVVAEAAIGYYREFGVRVASFTGLPTLLGMHQSEQRYETQVGQRDGEARTFFTEPDYARVAELARRLHIKYIYVGQLEHVIYPAAGLAKFDRAVGSYLDLVYENPRTRIYQVR